MSPLWDLNTTFTLDDAEGRSITPLTDPSSSALAKLPGTNT